MKHQITLMKEIVGKYAAIIEMTDCGFECHVYDTETDLHLSDELNLNADALFEFSSSDLSYADETEAFASAVACHSRNVEALRGF